MLLGAHYHTVADLYFRQRVLTAKILNCNLSQWHHESLFGRNLLQWGTTLLYFKECGINAAKTLSAEGLIILILVLFIMFHLHGIFREFMHQQC